MKKELFRIENLYGGYINHIILDQVAFSIYTGEIVCLFGFNNAGKSTIVRILSGDITGKWEKDTYFCGQPAQMNSKDDARQIGIYCIGSQSKLFDNLSVAENIYIIEFPWYKRMDASYWATNQRAEKLFQHYNIDISPTEIVANLSEAQHFLIEIVMAAHSGAGLIVIDCLPVFSSPANLSQFKNLLSLLRESGISILYTCDTMNIDMLFSDRMIILRNGLKVKELTGPNYDLQSISLYATGFGHDSAIHEKRNLNTSVILSLKNVHFDDKNFDWEIYRGETIGIYHPNKDVLYNFVSSCINGDLSCDEILMSGSIISSFELGKWMKKNCCIVPNLSSDVCTFPNLSILENITIGIPRRGFIGNRIEDLVYNENKELINTAENCRISGSNSAAINAAIFACRLQFAKVELIMFLKPEMGLDPVSQNSVFSEILALNKYGKTVFILTDELSAIDSFCHQIISV